MQQISLSRVGIGLFLATAGILVAILLSGQRTHLLTPGEQLLGEMIKIKYSIESSLNSATELDASKLLAESAQYAEDGTNILVSRDGVIDGSKGDVKLRLIPKRENNLIYWTCSGTPVHSVPRSCKTPL